MAVDARWRIDHYQSGVLLGHDIVLGMYQSAAPTRTHTRGGSTAPTQNIKNGLKINRGESVYFIGGRQSITEYFDQHQNGVVISQSSTSLSITFDRVGGLGHGMKVSAKGFAARPLQIGKVLTHSSYRRRHGVFGTIRNANAVISRATKQHRVAYSVVQVAAAAVSEADHEFVNRNISGWANLGQIGHILSDVLKDPRGVSSDGTESVIDL